MCDNFLRLQAAQTLKNKFSALFQPEIFKFKCAKSFLILFLDVFQFEILWRRFNDNFSVISVTCDENK